MQDFQLRCEAAPDLFIRYDYPSLLDKSRSAIAEVLGVPHDTIVFLPNATTGINTVLRNIIYKEGDVILYFSPSIYGACERSIEYICETTPATSHSIPVTFPSSDAKINEDFIVAIKRLKEQGKTPKLAMFDAIVSMPGVRFPFELLVKTCREHGILSLVDAAHSIGMLCPSTDIRLGELDPDFWVSNVHKWMCVPRGCAAFYVPKRNQEIMRSTLPTSHGFVPKGDKGAKLLNPLPAKKGANVKSQFVGMFEFVGTVDNAPYLCVPTAIEYRKNRLGGEVAIATYLKNLAKRAGEIFVEVLGTEVMENEEGTLGRCSFSNVRLPLDSAAIAKEAKVDELGVGGLVRDYICERLIKDHKTFMQLMFHEGSWWVRLSSAVYLEEEDFEKGAQVLKQVCEKIASGGWTADA
jgi:selenocysteine lyase/cysteine desulfurase